MSVDDLKKFLILHDKHVAAYALQDGIPDNVKAKYLAEMAKLRAEAVHRLNTKLN